MDGISDESPLVPVLRLWDHVETLLQEKPPLFLATSTALGCFILIGGLKNVLLTLGFLAWLKRSQLQLSVRALLEQKAIWVAIGVCGLSWVSLRCLSWVLSGKAGTRASFGRPYLIPCRTTHTRMFPKKHSFSYSYLLVGIPVGMKGKAGGMISAETEANGTPSLGSPKAWYHVDAADYLARGTGHLGLRGKLDNYLTSQGADPADYHYAYLVTAAKFLGYHFNPVSFWYLYAKDKVLTAIVLEVNNTFGERRPYLVTRDFDAEAKQLSEATGNETEAKRATIRNSWGKDFHVSPFNSRKGSYSLMAADPLDSDLKGFRGIDVTINLSSSKGHAKLVARLFSEGSAVDPSTMTLPQKLQFLYSWAWVGYVTFPRIVKEAAALFFKRKLHVWYRPEPLKESLGREPDDVEVVLEKAFREYLRSLVEASTHPLVVKYMPSGANEGGEETFKSPTGDARPIDADTLQLKVLTPSFYARFAGYAHDVEAIFCEFAESCTLWVDRPDLLPKVFLKKQSPPLHADNATDFIAFKLIQALRRRPETIKRPLTSAEVEAPSKAGADIRGFRISSMDAFILGQEASQLRSDYRSAVIRLFMADRFFLGFTQLLDLVVLGARLVSAWTIARVLARAIS